MKRLRFFCPLCGQRLKAPKLECNHKGTTHQRKFYNDPDKYALDEVNVEIVTIQEGTH